MYFSEPHQRVQTTEKSMTIPATMVTFMDWEKTAQPPVLLCAQWKDPRTAFVE